MLPVINGKHLLAIVGLGKRIDQKDFSHDDNEVIEQFVAFINHNLSNYLRLQYYNYALIDHLPLER